MRFFDWNGGGTAFNSLIRMAPDDGAVVEGKHDLKALDC